MQIFYSQNISDNICILPEDEMQHCIKVLRKKIGDSVHIMDGKGNLFLAEITEISKKECRLKINSTVESTDKKNVLTMAVAPTKNIERFEWFLEKAAELGISKVIPFVSQNSERSIIKPERLEKVIVSAMKQSGNLLKPEISELTNFQTLIKSLSNSFSGDKFIAHCKDEFEKQELFSVLTKQEETLILIGPEGDFTKEEVELCLTSGFKSVTLGKSRLRTETAALYACAAVKIFNNE